MLKLPINEKKLDSQVQITTEIEQLNTKNTLLEEELKLKIKWGENRISQKFFETEQNKLKTKVIR